MKFLKNIFERVRCFFLSESVDAALNKAVDLLPEAMPIVQEIAALTPNRTDDEIVAAFKKFAVPGAAQYLAATPEKRGYVLLQLASAVLAAQFPGVATHILDTAIQLAVTGVKA